MTVLMSRNLWFDEKNRQEKFPPAFPSVNALKKVRTVCKRKYILKDNSFITIHSLLMFTANPCFQAREARISLAGLLNFP